MRKTFYKVLWIFIWVLGEGFQLYSQHVKLNFELYTDENIYVMSSYGEAPQFAIWVLDRESDQMKNVFITQKSATGNFIGRSGVPVALPFWFGNLMEHQLHFGIPTPKSPVADVDVVSGPTPKKSSLLFEQEVIKGTNWDYFIEINIAGDFTREFPLYDSLGVKDPYENGQPSIVYHGQIEAVPGSVSIPQLIGYTSQIYFDTTLYTDLDLIGNAKEFFKDIKVTCINIEK